MNTFKIHAKLPETWKGADIWAWNEPEGGNLFEKWPGEAMTDEENGYYFAELPDWINHIIISSLEGSVQTEKIEIRAQECWLEIGEELSSKVSYDCPQIMLRALFPDSWKAPLVWAWSEKTGKNVFDSWPGKVFHWDGEIYRIALPYWAEKIIISADGCQLKSEAIELSGGRDAYLKLQDASHYNLSTEPFNLREEKKEAEAVQPVSTEEKPAEPVKTAENPRESADINSAEPSGLKKQLILGAALVSAAAAAIIAVIRLIKRK